MIPRSRLIIVDDASFRWKVSSGKGRLIGNSGPGLVLTAQIEDPKPGRVMQMHLFSKVYQALDEYEQEHGTHKVSLQPSDVVKAIKYALKRGWKPMDKGGVFKLHGPLDLGQYELP